MSINITQLTTCIIRPTLKSLNMYSVSAEELMLGTCAQESHLGTYLRQLNGGPALGIYQMEPFTYEDVFKKVIQQNKKIRSLLEDHFSIDINHYPDESCLIYDLRLATAITRIQYWRFSEQLAKPGDVLGHANYWKKYYNTVNGKGTIGEFVDNFNNFVQRDE